MPNPKQKNPGDIFEQIEDAADYYPPEFYANLLQFYSNLSLSRDPLGDQYIPLSAVAQKGRNPKKFVVGIIPPAIKVTGRILDRSASVIRDFSSQKPLTAQVLADLGTEEYGPNLDISNSPGNSESVSSRAVEEASRQAIQSLDASIQDLAQALIERAAQEGIPLVLVSGHRSDEEQDALYAQGRSSAPGEKPKAVVTGARGGSSWHNYGFAFDVAIVKGNQPTWPPNLELWGRVGAIGEELGLGWGAKVVKPPNTDLGHFQWTGGLNITQVQGGARPPPPPPVSRAIIGDSIFSEDWIESGRKASDEIRQQFSKIATTGLNGTSIGLRYQAAQRAQIEATRLALNKLRQVPPLRLMVNPKSFSVRGEKLTSDGNWGRNGPIIEHWGDQQDKISGSGSVAGFYSISKLDANGPGLSRMARNFSQGYQNFQSLYLLYRNNAGLYTQDFGSQDQRLNLATLGSIYLYYDNILYIGSFDTFNVTEDDTKPFTLDYSFEFSVRAVFLLDTSNEQGHTYGAGSLFTRGSSLPISRGGS